MKHLHNAVLNFDAKTMIVEMIEEKTTPILQTCQTYLNTILDLRTTYDYFSWQFHEEKLKNDKRFGARVNLMEYQ